MDVYCSKCREPFEVDYFHDVAKDQGRTFDEVYADFRKRGCLAVDGVHSDYGYDDGKSMIISEVMDLMGDDVDGAASMLEDVIGMGYI